MSTLATADSKGGKKPQYKDYVSFLENYRNGKKDDLCSIATNDSGIGLSLNNSSNNSSSSINSDLTDGAKSGFKEYLDNYNNKKYSSVQPNFIRKPKPEEGKTLKTEVFIEINNPQNTTNKILKVFDVTNANSVTGQNQNNNVSKVSKIFEKNTTSNEKTLNINKQKINTYKFEQNGVEHKKSSIGEISKKFEESSYKTQSGFETTKVQLKKKTSISEMSKIFEETHTTSASQETQVETKKILVSQSNTLKQKEENTAIKSNGSTSPKPQINVTKPVLTSKNIQQTSCNDTVIHLKQDSSEHTHTSTNIPPPPPQPTAKSPIPTPPQQSTIPPPPPPQATQINIPPPPPPPPTNFSAKRTLNCAKAPNSAPKVQNGKLNDTVDGTSAPVVDRNDPRVKKLVYGALREMYGAYHDKANDYIATLPRNRVKKNNGLDSIINSIASQGGLEKLNGRINPTVENE